WRSNRHRPLWSNRWNRPQQRRVQRARQAPPIVARAPRSARQEYLVRIEPGRSLEPAVQAGFAVVARANLASLGVDVARLRSTRGGGANTVLQRLRAALPGAVVDRNTFYRTSALDCTAASCPKFAMIDWPPPPASCQIKATIGLIDTGVKADHPALRSRSLERLSSRSEDRRQSSDRHGTAVAALLVGDAMQTSPGLLPAADLVAVDAFHRNAEGGDSADSYDLVKAIDMLAARNVQVINLSLAGGDNEVVRDIVGSVTGKGVILVAAAGNGGAQAAPAFPAAYDAVVAVTAVDKDRRLFRRANRGDYIDFAAPGVNLSLADPRDPAGRTQSGTSFAAPFATAILAARINGGSKPEGSAEDMLRRSVIDLGDPGRDRSFGWGLVQASDICR
ncbi:MAG: S8 family serine peptidase, partial [Beijerinckiaceae bacterium]